MGKSPGKWIKTLLFGKKTARSQSVKGRGTSKSGNDRGHGVATRPTLSENSPVISEPVLISTRSNGVNPEFEKGNSSTLGIDAPFTAGVNEAANVQVIAGCAVANDPEKFKEEQAAIRTQAVFRGFLARRAFRALKGIIRLQALIRGHLVRRQAVVTLRSTLGIIKLQALIRGKKVRSSGLGLEINTKFRQVPKLSDTGKGKIYTNVFICKLLSSSLVVMPLHIHYDQEDANSVHSWMERWSFSRFWKTPSLPKKTLDTKSQAKRGGYAMETESGRPKRNVRRNALSNVDTGPVNIASEPEKPKRNPRKITATADSVQDHPQSELEKVKRNLRRVSSSFPETSDRPEIAIDAQPRCVSEVVDFPADTEEGIDDSTEKTEKDITPTSELTPDMDSALKSKAIERSVDQFIDNPLVVGSNTLPNTEEEENLSEANGDLNVKEEQTCSENQKTSKRRASFSTRAEYAENGVQNTPKLPSYMQATESAKAKLRGQCSPIFGSDSAEKNGTTRRHSLPSSTNGKLSSHSPRTHRILQANGKGGIGNDKSLLSSRDGNEKPIQVEWRR